MALLYMFPFVWLMLAASLLYAWRRPLLALWREPVFKAPILIVESDDWGAGPPTQAAALIAIAQCLERHHDVTGRPAVMTLALILAMPKPGMNGYESLADDAPTLNALRAGQASGVFALQLHGMLHFWPAALRAAANEQAEVRTWLDSPELTERLPSPLQSRWTNASTLPSTPHASEEIRVAVQEEVETFRKLLGAETSTPLVVVPPTFVWTREVEVVWAEQGVGVVITPGRRLTRRDADGKPGGQDKSMRNGDHAEGDVLYLVRDDYFEPIFGHLPEQALAALQRKAEQGRPCLLETHRSNFLAAAGGDLAHALAALDELYGRALHDHPTLRFASCAELGLAIRSGDANWIEQDSRRRFAIWLGRMADLPRFGKAARLTGLYGLLSLFASRPVARHA